MSQIALVTGANKGIGLATAKLLAEKGFTVLLGARDEFRGEQAAQELSQQGLKVQYFALDVTDDASVQAAARRLENEFDQLDVLVNNAAINVDNGRSVLEVTADEFRHAFETNVLGVVRTTQAFWPSLLKASSARVINVSSGLGRLHDMENESPSYSTSKTALNALTRQFAGLGAGKVSVNSICPGWVRTDMGGQSAQRSPEEGASIIIKLATMDSPPTGGYMNEAGTIEW